MCKGKAIANYIRNRRVKDGVTFSTVTYLGDGRNDYCAMTELGKDDLVRFIRTIQPITKQGGKAESFT